MCNVRRVFCVVFCIIEWYGDHRDLHERTHSFPTRLSSDLGVEAGAQRYFKHGAAKLTPREAARIAAILPLPKKREAISPSGFTRRYGRMITARIGVVRRDGLDACVYE